MGMRQVILEAGKKLFNVEFPGLIKLNFLGRVETLFGIILNVVAVV